MPRPDERSQHELNPHPLVALRRFGHSGLDLDPVILAAQTEQGQVLRSDAHRRGGLLPRPERNQAHARRLPGRDKVEGQPLLRVHTVQPHRDRPIAVVANRDGE